MEIEGPTGSCLPDPQSWSILRIGYSFIVEGPAGEAVSEYARGVLTVMDANPPHRLRRDAF
jgi:hypothetical protein